MPDVMENTATVAEANSAPATRIFAFPGAVTIQNVEEVTEEIRKLHLAPGETLVLDVVQTEIITTPGIQLVLAVANTLEQSGGALVIMKPKDTFNQAFDVLGLAPRLTQWEESKWLKRS